MNKYGTFFHLDNPAAAYRILEASKVSSYANQNSKYTPGKCLQMLQEVRNWNKVTQLPEAATEWYDLEIRIMGSYCKILCTIGRNILCPLCGYLVVTKIDNGD